MQWGLKEAKQKFNELVKRAVDEGPQMVTRDGEAVVVVVAAAQYERLTMGAGDVDEDAAFEALDQELRKMRQELNRGSFREIDS